MAAREGPEFEEFVQTAQAIVSGQPLDRHFLLGIWDGAAQDLNRAVNHLLGTAEKDLVREGQGGGGAGGGGSGKKEKKDKKEKKSKSDLPSQAAPSTTLTTFGGFEGDAFGSHAFGGDGGFGSTATGGFGIHEMQSQMQSHMQPHMQGVSPHFPQHSPMPPHMQPAGFHVQPHLQAHPPQQVMPYTSPNTQQMPPSHDPRTAHYGQFQHPHTQMQEHHQMPAGGHDPYAPNPQSHVPMHFQPPPMQLQQQVSHHPPESALDMQLQQQQNELAELEKQIAALQGGLTGMPGLAQSYEAAGFDGEESDSDSDNDWWHNPSSGQHVPPQPPSPPGTYPYSTGHAAAPHPSMPGTCQGSSPFQTLPPGGMYAAPGGGAGHQAAFGNFGPQHHQPQWGMTKF